MLPALVLLAPALFATALLAAPIGGRPAALHLILAAGAMPLIFGAMTYFIPVLTRSRAPAPGFAAVPLLALGGGLLAVAALALPGLVWARHAGALLALGAAGTLLVWSRRRRAAMLGRAHPGLAWYEAALGCLALALLAILATAVWPQHLIALRHLHLHLNTLGFIGLTAIGTLVVLLPTATARPDPQAGPWLQANLAWALAGVLLVAVGAAGFAPLAWIGAVLWAAVLTRLCTRWLQRHRREIVSWHGSAPVLAAAPVGLGVSLVAGALDVVPAAPALHAAEPAHAFVLGFLFPLVSGAASQLLPVWLRPGAQGDWHAALRGRLGRFGGVRAALFLLGGVAAGAGQAWSTALGAAVLLAFLLQTGVALLQALFASRRNHP